MKVIFTVLGMLAGMFVYAQNAEIGKTKEEIITYWKTVENISDSDYEYYKEDPSILIKLDNDITVMYFFDKVSNKSIESTFFIKDEETFKLFIKSIDETPEHKKINEHTWEINSEIGKLEVIVGYNKSSDRYIVKTSLL